MADPVDSAAAAVVAVLQFFPCGIAEQPRPATMTGRCISRGQQQSSADGAQARGEKGKMKRAARAVALSHFTAEAGLLPFFAPAVKTSDARNSMKGLVAGGGFVPQSHIDSAQLTDSTIVPNAKKGYKGKSFIQFSFSSCFHRSTRILAWAPLLHRSLREVPL